MRKANLKRSAIAFCLLQSTGLAPRPSETYGIERPGCPPQSTNSIRNKQARWTVPVLSALANRFESRDLYLRAPGLTLLGLQLRPSKVGRPKGSRNKLPRASKTDKATSLTQGSFQILDSAINSHQIDSSRRAQSSVEPAITLELRDTHRPRVPIAFHTPSFEPLDTRRPYTSAAPAFTSDGGRPFEPADAYHRCASDAAAPAHGAPGFADPFHFDWPHW
jgi:hypothetical protein